MDEDKELVTSIFMTFDSILDLDPFAFFFDLDFVDILVPLEEDGGR